MPRRKKDTSSSKFIVIFEDHPVRRVWVEKDEKWYFAIIDIIRVLTQSTNPQVYWRVLKKRLLEEGSNETVTNCNGLKMVAPDGKKRLTDTADTETVLRIIQSIPSQKAEPFKLWLAKVGYERLQETVDPELGINRARKNWQMLGRSEKWIEGRMRGQEVRNKLTDYWSGHGVKEGIEFAKLTNVIHTEWSGITVNQHKRFKGLKRENLRDNMTDAELIFTALAELSTTKIAKVENADGYKPNEVAAKKGGLIARGARVQLEKQIGERVVSSESFIVEGELKKRKRLK